MDGVNFRILDQIEICGSSSVGRATAFQAVGRGFEPRLPLSVEMTDDFMVAVKSTCNGQSQQLTQPL